MTLDNLEIEREDIGKKVYRITEHYHVKKTFRVLAKDEDEAKDKLIEQVRINWEEVEITGFDSDVQYYGGKEYYDTNTTHVDGEILEEDFHEDEPDYYDNQKMKAGY